MNGVGIDGFDEDFPACETCGLPLSPRSVVAHGHAAVELFCPQHGVQRLWEPFRAVTPA